MSGNQNHHNHGGGHNQHHGSSGGGTGHHLQLQDGFQDVLTFRGHRLQLRGFNIIESLEDPRRQTKFSQNQHYVSWDVKQVLLWGFDPNDANSKISIVNQVKFSNQPNYICAIVHINKMKVFLAAALDMSFKLFDNHLNLLESIHHEERAILQLEYDAQKELIFSSGANGISAWRLYRNTALDKAHIMEKLYNFSGCDTWITNMIYQGQYNRIFAIKETTVQVLSTTRRAVVTTLENCHEAPINVTCWYERNQFYLTGCSRGEIKCWTSNYTQADDKKASNTHGHPSFGQTHHPTTPGGNANSGGDKNFALLHTFKGHIKGVTAIHLHPVSGLAISAGLDGFLKVLNLEALNELFSIHVGSGILGMRIVKLPHNHHGCLVSLADATIKLWKITSVCDFFAVASSKIARVDTFENLEAELEYHYKMRRPETREVKKELSVMEHLVLANSGVNVENMVDSNKHSDVQATNSDHHPLASLNQQDVLTSGGYLSDKILVTQSNQDLRVFTHKGVLLGRLEPEHLIDGIKGLCVSVYQKLLFCLCEGSRVRVFDLKRFNLPLLYEFSLRSPSTPSYKSSALMDAIKTRKGDNTKHHAGKGEHLSQTSKDVTDAEDKSKHPLDGDSQSLGGDGDGVNDVDEDIGVCCTLIDIAPASVLRAPKFAANSTMGHESHHLPSKFDIRGEKIGHYIDSFLLLGLSTGSIVFLDVLNQFEVIMSFQAINGIVLDLKYRRRYRELIMYGKDYSQLFTTIKIWKLPEMELIGEYGDLRKVNCFAVSNSLNFFAVGTTDGVIRLFSNHIEDKVIQEITQPGEGHDSTISSICFLDDIRVFCSCSTDGKVKFWDFEKRLVRSIQLNIPTCSVIQNGGIGDVLMAQNHYLLTIPKRIWNEDDVLGQMKLLQMHEEELNNKQPLRLEGDVTHAEHPDNKEQVMDLKARSVDAGDDASKSKGIDVSPSRRSSIQERKASRRYSKLSTSNQASQSSLRKPSLNRKQSSFKGLSQASSAASLKYEEDGNGNGNGNGNINGRTSDQMTYDEIEKEILLPILKSKQYQYIDRDGSTSPPRRTDTHFLPTYPNNNNNQEDTFMHSQEVSAGQESFVDMQGSIFPSDSMQLEMRRYETDAERTPRNNIIDTLHPRFLIHKKAPARMIQLEDIQEHVNRYMQIAGMNSRNTFRKSVVNPIPTQESNAAVAPSQKANPHFGLSPRARLTLISSRPQSKQGTKDTKGGDSNAKDKAQEEEAMVMRAQEKLILDLSLGMQVSNEYKQQRVVLNQERQQRMTIHQQRSTFVVKPTPTSPSKEAVEPVEIKRKTTRRKNLRHGTLYDTEADNTFQSGTTTPTTESASVNSDPDATTPLALSPDPIPSRKRVSIAPVAFVPTTFAPLSIDTDAHINAAPFSPGTLNIVLPSQQNSNEESFARRKPLKPTFIPPPININL